MKNVFWADVINFVSELSVFFKYIPNETDIIVGILDFNVYYKSVLIIFNYLLFRFITF